MSDITDDQIDDFFADSPFVARGNWQRHKSEKGFEVIEQENEDWRAVITNDEPKHHGYFDTYAEAEAVKNRLHLRRFLTITTQTKP